MAAVAPSLSTKGSDLVRRYFVQLVDGCGRKGCPNRYCFTCVDGPGRLDRTAAALRSLELAQGSTHHLCDEQPPFLHLELVRELVAEAARTGEVRPLQKEVSGVFSNADALNRSFLLSDAARQAAAKELRVPIESTSGLDTQAVSEAYCELLRLQSTEVIAAVMNATDSLLRTLQVAQLSQPSFISDGAALRQFVILLLNPLLLEPQYHKQILLSLLSLAAALPPPCVDRLAFWLSLLPTRQLAQMVTIVQQFLTVRLCHTQRIDDAVIAATRVLGQLYAANELATEAGHRVGDDAFDYRRFYNDAINQEVRRCTSLPRSNSLLRGLSPSRPPSRPRSRPPSRPLSRAPVNPTSRAPVNPTSRTAGLCAPPHTPSVILRVPCLQVNLKEDYRRWKSTRGEFSFCDHQFVLEPASKSRILMYDATAQMTHEFEGAILRSLFVGATSPYLVVKVAQPSQRRLPLPCG